MSAEDFSFATQLANTTDWNMEESDFKFMTALEPQGCFVAFQDSERVGIATSISYGRLGWFGNLIVKNEYRGEGVGSLLVNYSLDYLRGKGVETVGLYAYSNLIGFYEKLGFKQDVDFSVMVNENLSCPLQDRLQRAKRRDIPALIEFDRQCFGADRQKLLSAILLESTNLCYLAFDGNEVTGYVAAKVYKEMAEVGPLMCKDADAAKVLLETVLSHLQGSYVSVCLPKKEKSLIALFNDWGFKEDFNVLRMFLGSPIAMDCICIAESLERG